MMRLILYSIVFPLLVISIVGNSFAQSSNKDSTIVFVQTVVRNSDGQMIAYLEANKVYVPNLDLFKYYLDLQPPLETFDNQGKKFDHIHLEFTSTYNDDEVISKTAFGFVKEGKETMLVFSDHAGIPVRSGDTLTSIWTIFRPSHSSS